MDECNKFILKNLSNIIKILLIVLCLIWFFEYSWKRRWLYYYASKLPGPFTLPIIGTVKMALAGQKGILNVLENFLTTYPPVFKCWVANQLCIFTSRPSDVEFILSNCLHKQQFMLYNLHDENFSSILTSKVEVWKIHRRIINQSFNPKLIDSYTSTFVKNAKNINLKFENCDKNHWVDVLPVIWESTTDMFLESFMEIDPNLFTKKMKFLQLITRYQDLVSQRSFNPLYKLNFFWKNSSLFKETKSELSKANIYIKELIQLHKDVKNLRNHKEGDSDNNLKEKHFLSHLLGKDLTIKEIEEEITFMFMAGSETIALAMSSVLVVLSIYPEIQEKIYQEQCAIFKNIDSDATLDDINSMNYLERVIKETLRVLPPALYIARYIDKLTKLESCTVPADCAVIIPINYIHKDPKVWPDPNKFDPDRFLPEEVQKRPRTSYIPFSYGPRNCIGLKYGMQAMKATLSTILRKFQVERSKYKTIEEIEVEFHLVAKAKQGYKLCLKKGKLKLLN